MRNLPNVQAENHRITKGRFASAQADGNNGHFYIAKPPTRKPLRCVVSDGAGWDHVSVTVDVVPPRTPTWEEMAYVKQLFFRDDECVVQFHPPESVYVNTHEYCLHLWRSQDKEQAIPPSVLTGYRKGVRGAEGGDGTTVLAIELDRTDTAMLHALASASGLSIEQMGARVAQGMLKAFAIMHQRGTAHTMAQAEGLLTEPDEIAEKIS